MNKNGLRHYSNGHASGILKLSDVKTARASFFIVGVGASAGGLEAFTELLHDIPRDTSMGFVLVQHLAAFHESLLTELLSKATSLPVTEVTDEMVVQPAHVYVIPPNKEMTIRNGTLYLSNRKNTEGRNTSIDIFFRSLGEDQKERAIGIILSGSESDGVLGLEAIKAEGGITFAQDESSAKFKDMPRKAAASGVVDFIMTPRAIALRLARLPARDLVPYFVSGKKMGMTPKDEKVLFKILDHLKIKTGMDFTFYKTTTILRRVTRRMVLQRMEDLQDYLAYVSENADEAKALRKDLLINVTSFFRDPDCFDVLKTKIFPQILKRRQNDKPVRIWIPGCSTGNEAYSVAICLDEFLKNKSIPVQIFATDVNDTAVESARRGAYPDNIKLDVSAGRLERYFHKTNDGYEIKKFIRDSCVFAAHNMLTDPPFSDIDLISCRNVMIYMEPQLQKKAIAFFHYSLKPSGFLMLGGSESVGEFSEYFSVVNKKQKIYSKKKLHEGHRLHFSVGSSGSGASRDSSHYGHPKGRKISPFDVQNEANKILNGKASKNGVLINENMDIVEFYGHTQPFIRPAPGQASFSLFQMAHKSLLTDLCMAVHRAKKEKKPMKEGALEFGNSKFVDIEVIPIPAPVPAGTHFLILFKMQSQSTLAGKRLDVGSLTKEIKGLKQDLWVAKESLVALMREQGGMTEEFRAQNEEIQSSNEEFQSTNEELETAKEELQSANEELTTVNSEMEIRNAELTQTNDDLNNLILSVHTSIILLDASLKVRRFSAKAGKSMGIVTADVGRRIMDIPLNFTIRNFEQLIREVMETLEAKEKEIQDDRGHWYLMRIRPYRRQDGKVDGVVLMFVNIMDIKQSMLQLQDAKNYSETIVETLWEPLVVLGSALRIRSANKAFYDFFHVSKQDVSGKLIYDLGNGQWNIPELKELLEELLAKNNAFYNFEMEHDFPVIGSKLMILNAHKIALKEDQKEEIIILAFQDITEQRHAENALNKIASELSFSNKELEGFASTAAHDLKSPLNKIQIFAERLLGEGISEKGKSYLHTMIKSSKRMGSLVENLLRVSRVTSEGHERERVHITEIVEEVISDLAIAIQESGAVIEKADLPLIWANRVQMRQLFQNLIGNSIKHCKKNEPPLVTITSLTTGDSVEIAIKDNGIGFDEKYARDIFKPFKRLHGTSEYEGSGIGLALCQKIVRHHGGEILVKSRGGEGTTFTLKLPIKVLNQSPGTNE